MGYSQDGNVVAYPSDADLSAEGAGQYRAVKRTATGIALCGANASDCIGILQDNPALGRAGTVKTQETSKAVAGAAITAGAKVKTDSAGRFVPVTAPVAAVAAVSNKALTSNVATLTTSAAHGFETGQTVVVAGVDSTFNGSFTIASVPSATTFTYAKTAADVASAAVSPTGTATVAGEGIPHDNVIGVAEEAASGTGVIFPVRLRLGTVA